MTASQEIITIVDRYNRIKGSARRWQMRAKGLIHRAAYILVFNSARALYVQKRTLTKDIYPGFYDVAAGGVVLAGETYDESARRELAEEMGIREIPVLELFDFYHEDGQNRVWGRAYHCTYDGNIVLQKEEVESGGYYPVDEILRSSRHQAYTPDGLYVLQRYLQENR